DLDLRDRFDGNLDEGELGELIWGEFCRVVKTHLISDVPLGVLLSGGIDSILDEPLADASIMPTYLLSRFTKGYVKVALGGDGGDELFAGYPTYQAFL